MDYPIESYPPLEGPSIRIGSNVFVFSLAAWNADAEALRRALSLRLDAELDRVVAAYVKSTTAPGGEV